MGVLPGIIGTMQANEAIKILAGIGTTLSGRLMIIDTLDFSTRFIRFKPNPTNPVSGSNPTIHKLIDYEEFCNPAHLVSKAFVEEISPAEVSQMLFEGQPFQLIDVREPLEYQMVNIGAENIPLKSIKESVSLVNREGIVVVHCKSGQRSAQAIRKLQEEFGFSNLKNMTGGLLRWRQEVNPDLPIS